MKRVLALSIVVALWATPARAQLCAGGIDTPMQLNAGVGFTANSRDILAVVTRDMGKYVVDGGLALLSISGVSLGKGFTVGGAMKLTVKGSKPIAICPGASFTKLFGIDPGPGFNISPSVLSFGASIGIDVAKINTTHVVPTVAITINRVSENFGGGGGFSENGASLRLGAGLIFNERMALVPAIVVPIHMASGEFMFAVVFAYKLH